MQNRTHLMRPPPGPDVPWHALPWRNLKNMIGRQSQNEGCSVLPAPGKVTIDGDLTDWDFSGRVWVFADKGVRQRYSVEVAGLMGRIGPVPGRQMERPHARCYNTIDPEFNVEDGWKSDSWQMRIRTERTWLDHEPGTFNPSSMRRDAHRLLEKGEARRAGRGRR